MRGPQPQPLQLLHPHVTTPRQAAQTRRQATTTSRFPNQPRQQKLPHATATTARLEQQQVGRGWDGVGGGAANSRRLGISAATGKRHMGMARRGGNRNANLRWHGIPRHAQFDPHNHIHALVHASSLKIDFAGRAYRA